jgi:hypothetical protein|tara:strand:+ start:532 stop:2379 length:1848 start_codon:yes stop_codon:yes gene_type:complete
MKTIEQYRENNFPIIPCKRNSRVPIGEEWQKTNIEFQPGDNIGLHLTEHIDIDVDNIICHKFLASIKQRGCAIYGRQSNPESHLIFKGQTKYEKYVMDQSFAPWFNKYRKKATILEIRSGKGKQSIVPGSIIDDELVEWNRYIEPEEYPGNLQKDIELVVFATMLSIIYPAKGQRDDFCYAIACLLMKWGKWSEDKINTFIYELSEASEPPETRDRNSIKDKHGTKAYKGNKPKGLPWLINEAGYTEQGIKRIFEVIGIKIGKEQKEEFKKESLDPGAWRNGILAEVIAKEEFKPIDWLVENIIAPGLTIIAGKSKIGKSWLVLHLSYCIEKGEEFLGRKCAKGDVLHYSLEDGKRRIKTRWDKMCIQPDQTYYQFRDRKPKIPILTMGLEEEIEDWANNIPNPKMVVIDVYVKVKKTISKSLNAYENDNYNLQNLQTLAIKYNIGIVLVHHTKKGSENDVFDEINGSAGIQSNMDSMIVLASSRKAGKNSVFHCIPKDAEQLEFEVGMNEQMIWEDKGPVGSTSLTMLQERIVKVVNELYAGNPALGDDAEESGTPVKAKDIIERIKADDELTEKSGRKGKPFTKEDINKNLERLFTKGHILKTRRGEYQPAIY